MSQGGGSLCCDKGQWEGPLEGTPSPHTLIYPLHSLIQPLYNSKGPFKGLCFSPLNPVEARSMPDSIPRDREFPDPQPPVIQIADTREPPLKP